MKRESPILSRVSGIDSISQLLYGNLPAMVTTSTQVMSVLVLSIHELTSNVSCRAMHFKKTSFSRVSIWPERCLFAFFSLNYDKHFQSI